MAKKLNEQWILFAVILFVLILVVKILTKRYTCTKSENYDQNYPFLGSWSSLYPPEWSLEIGSDFHGRLTNRTNNDIHNFTWSGTTPGAFQITLKNDNLFRSIKPTYTGGSQERIQLDLQLQYNRYVNIIFERGRLY